MTSCYHEIGPGGSWRFLPGPEPQRIIGDHVMACTAFTTPASRPHPNLAAYRAALRGIVRLKRLQAQTAAIEAGQMAEGL
jgi:hypothetical protein